LKDVEVQAVFTFFQDRGDGVAEIGEEAAACNKGTSEQVRIFESSVVEMLSSLTVDLLYT